MVWALVTSTPDAMFRFRRDEPPDPGDAPTAVTPDAAERECRVLLERWRISEQHVWRSWKAWLAADANTNANGGDSGACYGLLLRAIAEEEKAAAAFELLVQMLSANRSASA